MCESGFTLKLKKFQLLPRVLEMRGALQCLHMATYFCKVCKCKIFSLQSVKTIVSFYSGFMSYSPFCGVALESQGHLEDLVRGKLRRKYISLEWDILQSIIKLLLASQCMKAFQEHSSQPFYQLVQAGWHSTQA